MTKKKAPEPSEVLPISDVKLVRIERDSLSYPAAVYNGEAPQKGEKLRLLLENDVEYEGIVFDVTEASGEVLVEFENGLTPVQK